MLRKFGLSVVLLVSMTMLAACESAEERAEGHYQKGLELIAEGDVDRALVELRNVFQLNGQHRDARWTYATLVEERGDLREAFGQLLRLIEQYPQDAPARVALTRLTQDVGNWEELERHHPVASELAPEDPMVRSGGLILAYRAALQERDFQAAGEVAQAAEALAEEVPTLFSLRRVIVDHHLRRQDWPATLAAIDAALALRAEDRQMHVIRLGVLEQMGNDTELEAHLRTMTTLFPEDQQVHDQLIRWYLSRDEADKAETYLRSRIEAEEDTDAAHLALVGFLLQTAGLEPARAEVERILEIPGTDTALFRSTRAGIDFDLGQRDQAIAEMEDILRDAAPSEQTHNIKITLANMLIRTGNAVGARALVEEVLAEDATHVAALKLKANWLIEDDNTGDAIVELRRALDQAPQDAELRTLMARAYERAGNRELMAEMLALAVEASGRAPAESLRYANYLMVDNKPKSAETVLIDALRLQPQNIDLLFALGGAFIRNEEFAQNEQLVARLGQIDDDRARTLARELQARQLAAQSRESELLNHLTNLARDGELEAGVSIIRLKLSQGDTAGALTYVDELLVKDPDSQTLRFLRGLVLAANGEVAMAETIFRTLLEERPEADNVWMALYNLHRARGETDKAAAVLAEAREATPDSVPVNWTRASDREFEGDIEGAIAIYEELYAANSDSVVFANNLASLLSSYREDPESLQRAYAIARRLRGTDFPAFQDTYGWIAHQLGNHEEALSYLEPAAEGLPEDPLVHYHLGATYASLGRIDEARTAFETAIALIEGDGLRRETLGEIEQALADLSRNASTAEN